MMGHKICFYGEIWLIIPKLSLLPLLICSTELNIVYIDDIHIVTSKGISITNYLFI